MYITREDMKQAALGIVKQKKMIDAELDSIGDSRIVCRNKGDKLYYTETYKTADGKSRERGISKDKEQIKRLVRKLYLTEYRRALDNNLDSLENCLKDYTDIKPSELIKSITKEHHNLPIDMIMNCKMENLETAPYNKNEFYPEHLQYTTTGGVTMRSKSERAIGEVLEAMGIPYRYDMKIQCKKAVHYADFVIKRKDGSTLIWEHFGRTHDDEYIAKNIVRVLDYFKEGYRIWDNLVWTFESDLKNSSNIRKIIKKYILMDE